MSNATAVLKTIEDEDLKYVDSRFTDPRGKWRHIAQAMTTADEAIFEEGTWHNGHDSSDDLASAVMDPFPTEFVGTTDRETVIRR